ncbi:hypothetical protein FDECE_2537 [Fusarium decemcellulare]|nr:hypothetical protein FDECE_2537 [Fusarium decemcellulare]
MRNSASPQSYRPTILQSIAARPDSVRFASTAQAHPCVSAAHVVLAFAHTEQQAVFVTRMYHLKTLTTLALAVSPMRWRLSPPLSSSRGTWLADPFRLFPATPLHVVTHAGNSTMSVDGRSLVKAQFRACIALDLTSQKAAGKNFITT